MNIARFKKFPLMGILRGISADNIEPLVEAIISAGLETIEITMNTQGAAGLIKKAKSFSGNRLVVGAGTVLTMDELKSAVSVGAEFIVSPVVVNEVIEYCVKNKMPVFPGALTPGEIYNAWQRGAVMVKVFPAKCFGPEYFKEIKGPFNDIELLACAGVTPENMQDYFANGASAVSFGASVFKREWLERGDFDSIEQSIKKYVQGYKVISRKS